MRDQRPTVPWPGSAAPHTVQQQSLRAQPRHIGRLARCVELGNQRLRHLQFTLVLDHDEFGFHHKILESIFPNLQIDSKYET
jgi:hypothetical protein